MAPEEITQSVSAGEFVEPDDALPPTTLADLPQSLRAGAARAGWNELMPVQARSIPYLVAGRDLMVQSRTGSGKTGAFLLPILDRINPNNATCQALILVPTRELAKQVAREAEMLFTETGARTVEVYGGVGYGKQLEGFRAGAHLVVGTPGRVLDHLLKRSLTLDDLQMLVFDEADRMLSMGFYPDMIAIHSHLPKRRVDGFMFSATFPPYVMNLAGTFLHEPSFLSLSKDNVHVAEVDHVYYLCEGMKKDRTLVRILEIENPGSAIIFCNTKARVDYVTTVLGRFGFDVDKLHSDLSQKDRERVLDRVRNNTLRFLVATDVAARGIDIPSLSHVIQYEPPEDPEAYIHRAGRTGRAGASGEAITLVDPVQKMELGRIVSRFEIGDLEERPTPEDGDAEAIVAERATALLEAKYRDKTPAARARVETYVPLARELAASESESAVIAMLLEEFYQESAYRAPSTADGDAPNQDQVTDDDGEAEDVLGGEEATALLQAQLREKDRVEQERVNRFVPLARELAANEEESAVVAMLLEEFCRTPSRHSPSAAGPAPADQKEGRQDDGAKNSGKGRRRGRRRK